MIIGHIFYSTSSFVHHFKSIGEFILELQFRNAQFWSKLAIFCPVWPWNLTMTLENNRAPLLYYIKLCASFQSHGWIQTGVTVRKRSIRVKISNFLFHVTLKFDGWPWKTTGNLFFVASSFVHHFIAISRDSPTVWCLCAFFPILSQFYVPFYVKKRKLDNFMCLLEFECAKRLKAHSQAIPASVNSN